MNAKAIIAAIIALFLAAVPTAVGAAAADDKAFDAQARAIQEGIDLTQDAGLFGRPGDRPGAEGPRASSVGDRDLDRYVQRLAIEIRLRNTISDRDPEGFR